jgi:poly-gamma-glutamate synthesis protein (capsule biosynthesis protein)
VDAGADLVVGCHPHVLQGFQLMTVTGTGGTRRALVAYSLGNFLFDQKGVRTRESVVLRVTLGRGGVTAANLVPLTVDGARPRPATPEEAAVSLGRLAKLCREFHTKLAGTAFVLP